MPDNAGMADADDINDAIVESATGPQKVVVDGVTVEQHPLADQILAQQHVARQSAAARNHGGIRFFKCEPPGAG